MIDLYTRKELSLSARGKKFMQISYGLGDLEIVDSLVYIKYINEKKYLHFIHIYIILRE